MIVPVMAISNLVLTQQIYSEETNGAHAHYREPVPLSHDAINLLWTGVFWAVFCSSYIFDTWEYQNQFSVILRAMAYILLANSP